MDLQQSSRKNMIKNRNPENVDSELLEKLNSQINELEIKLNLKQEENRNLLNIYNCQKIAHETLLRAPQNFNYSILKKNYEMQK